MENTILKKEFKFEAAHCLGFHKGKCHNVHGHQWKIILYLKNNCPMDENMIIDFYDIKKIIEKYLEEYDHSFIYYCRDDHENNIGKILEDYGSKTKMIYNYSTCENLSKMFYEEIKALLKSNKEWWHLQLVAIEVYESEGSSCIYKE